MNNLATYEVKIIAITDARDMIDEPDGSFIYQLPSGCPNVPQDASVKQLVEPGTLTHCSLGRSFFCEFMQAVACRKQTFFCIVDNKCRLYHLVLPGLDIFLLLSAATGQSCQNLTNKMKRNNFTEEDIRSMASALNCETIIEFRLPDGTVIQEETQIPR